MPQRLLSLVLILFVLACSPSKPIEHPLLAYVPEDAALVIKINNLNTFLSELKNNRFLADIAKEKSIEKLNQAFMLNKIEADTTALVAMFEDDSTHILFITYARQPGSVAADSMAIAQKPAPPAVSEKGQFHSLTTNGIKLISTSESLIDRFKNGTLSLNKEDSLDELYKTASDDKSASIFVNTRKPMSLLPTFLSPAETATPKIKTDWITFDLNSSQHYLYLNGLTKVQDTATNFLKLFHGTHPVRNISPDIASASADAILSYTFDDFEIFARNQNSYFNSPYSVNTDLQSVEEVGIIYQNNAKAVLLSTFDSEAVQKFLDGIAQQGRAYQGYDIAKLVKNDFITKSFSPLIENFKANFYTIIDNKYLFSEKEDLLESIIGNYNNGNVFSSGSLFRSVDDGLTGEANILFVANARGMKMAASSFLSTEVLGIINRAKPAKYGYTAQVVADKDYYHTHFSVNTLGSERKSGTTAPLFTVVLDNEIASDPQFVINHRTGKKEIVVQDTNHNLYLISTDGKVLWKKQLQSRVQGPISQVDLYKNGRLQLAFTTADQFIILDRNGKEVAPFVKSYPGGNLNALAVFDYEKNRGYRFVVTQGTKVYMYNSRGNVVTGFTYTEAESPILEAPKHIRVGNRDYLLFKLENGRLKILNRVGKERISVDQDFQFSSNSVYLYRNKFILTDRGGVLFSVDTKGKTDRSSLNMNEDHGIYATAKTLVTLNENTITIKGKNRDLELGVYLPPTIFYVYDKIYVSTTDIQSGQVYLFDSRNEPISNFPVFGNSNIDLADMDNDGNIELVTKDQDNSLIVYSIH
ncbi:MAG: ribonuclease HII [Flavobacteriaceae bacterium]